MGVQCIIKACFHKAFDGSADVMLTLNNARSVKLVIPGSRVSSPVHWYKQVPVPPLPESSSLLPYKHHHMHVLQW